MYNIVHDSLLEFNSPGEGLLKTIYLIIIAVIITGPMDYLLEFWLSYLSSNIVSIPWGISFILTLIILPVTPILLVLGTLFTYCVI